MSLSDDHMIEQYLNGELSALEEEAFLLRVKNEHELQEQLRLEKQMREALDEADWSAAENASHEEVTAYAKAFGSPETQALKNSIAEASAAYHQGQAKPGSGRTIRLWLYSAAATVLITISFFLLRPKPISPQDLYAEYLAKTELPDLTTRSATDEAAELLRAQGFFNNKEYDRAASAFEKLLSQMPERAELYINLALSQAELGKYDQAIAQLDQLIKSKLLDATKGYWFQSLVYLKAGETEKSEALLKTIVDNRYYNHELAAKLLKNL